MAEETIVGDLKGVTPPETAQVLVAPDLATILSVFPGSPSKDQMEIWKQEHGEIFCSGFSETELFIWRPLARKEYSTLQKMLRTPPVQGQEPMSELDYEEAVVKQCILWSSARSVLAQKGGSFSTLSEQIMMNSNFMSPQMASAFVIKL